MGIGVDREGSRRSPVVQAQGRVRGLLAMIADVLGSHNAWYIIGAELTNNNNNYNELHNDGNNNNS